MGTLVQFKRVVAKRPGLLSVAGRAIEVRCRWMLQGYFLAVARYFAKSFADVQQLYMQVDTAVAQNSQLLRLILARNIAVAVHHAGAQTVFTEAARDNSDDNSGDSGSDGLAADLNVDIVVQRAKQVLDKLGPTGAAAAQYAADKAAAQVTGIDETTRDLLRGIIGRGIEEMKGVDGIAREIRKAVEDMSKWRALSIAATEMNDAMSTVSLDKIKRMDLYKRWIAHAGACRLCQDNAAAGAIEADAAFPSGHQHPPAHPGKCRCAVVAARKV